MRFTFQWYCMALLVSSMCQPAAGQLAAPETLASPGQTIELLENLSTLESIRLGSTGSPAEGAGGSGMAAMMVGMGSSAGASMGTSSGKQLLLQHINQLRLMLNAPNQDRKELEPMLREALAEYFVLGHAELYQQYRFDEPWDSDNNIKLVEKMPAVFSSKSDHDAKKGMTSFQMLVGGGAAFDLSRPTQFIDITDGTSNTIALVVASQSVLWTKPEDVQFEPNNLLAKLAPSRLVAMCDGAVRTLPAEITEHLFAIYATCAGGEPTSR